MHVVCQTMSLNPEFKNYLNKIINNIIVGIPSLKKEYPKLKIEWRFDSEFDFLYGCIVGQILGSCLTAFRMSYNREAKADELLGIGEIVESYFPLIRDEIKNN